MAPVLLPAANPVTVPSRSWGRWAPGPSSWLLRHRPSLWASSLPLWETTPHSVFPVNAEVSQGATFYLTLFLLCVFLRCSLILSRSWGFSQHLQVDDFCIYILALALPWYLCLHIVFRTSLHVPLVLQTEFPPPSPCPKAHHLTPPNSLKSFVPHIVRISDGGILQGISNRTLKIILLGTFWTSLRSH